MPKAIIKSIESISDGSGDGWDLTVNAQVSDGGSGVDLQVTAHASSFMPDAGWGPIIRQAVIDKAQADLQVVVDAVLAPSLIFL